MRFFLPIRIPTKTAQEKKLALRGGRPVIYTPPELRDIRSRYVAALIAHAPEKPMAGPIRLYTEWIFPQGRHRAGEFKITKPDTDNMIKLFKDAMTDAGFWLDDAQVAVEMTEKRYGPYEGVYVIVEELRE